MKNIVAVILLGIVTLAIGCSPFTVRHDYDPKVDFNSLKSYAWLPIPPTVDISELTIKRIKHAVNTQLQAKDYVVDINNPDFLIAAHAGTKEQIRVTDWGYGYGTGYRGSYWGYEGIDVHQYEVGTLILDFVDAKTEQVIWRGEVKAVLDASPTPEQQDKTINEAMAEVLKKFPPEVPAE